MIIGMTYWLSVWLTINSDEIELCLDLTKKNRRKKHFSYENKYIEILYKVTYRDFRMHSYLKGCRFSGQERMLLTSCKIKRLKCKIFSLNRITRPMYRCMSVCVSVCRFVTSWNTLFRRLWRPLGKGRICNIGLQFWIEPPSHTITDIYYAQHFSSIFVVDNVHIKDIFSVTLFADITLTLAPGSFFWVQERVCVSHKYNW